MRIDKKRLFTYLYIIIIIIIMRARYKNDEPLSLMESLMER